MIVYVPLKQHLVDFPLHPYSSYSLRIGLTLYAIELYAFVVKFGLIAKVGTEIKNKFSSCHFEISSTCCVFISQS